jgi:hypothetical protein
VCTHGGSERVSQRDAFFFAECCSQCEPDGGPFFRAFLFTQLPFIVAIVYPFFVPFC